jgi:hypothetical protein
MIVLTVKPALTEPAIAQYQTKSLSDGELRRSLIKRVSICFIAGQFCFLKDLIVVFRGNWNLASGLLKEGWIKY